MSLEITIHHAPFWYEVDGQAEWNSHGYFAVPFVYGSQEDYDDEPVACGPLELITLRN